jgi:hypothetical protein
MSAKHIFEFACRLLHPSGRKVVGVIIVDGKPVFQTRSAESVEEVLQSAKTIREQFEALEESWIHGKHQTTGRP